MYESFYNLRTKPFSLLPDSDFLYPGSVHQAAYSLLEYGLLSQAPFMVLTGDPGMGKTSLLQKLIAEHGRTHSIGLITNARYDIEHLLPWILLSLGLSTKQLDPVEAYHIFSQFLAQESKQHRRVILIVWNFLEWWKLELSYTYGRREVVGYSETAMSNATMFMLTYYPPKLAFSN